MWAALGWFIVKMVVAIAISYVLRSDPDIEEPSPAGIEEFDFPTAKIGREFPVLFGTKAMPSQNVVWYGNLRVEEVEESSGGGLFGGGETYTVAYKYYLNTHMVLAHDVQSIKKVVVDKKTVWSGDSLKMAIDEENLWGGAKRGGGIQGMIEVLPGHSDQEVNPYLDNWLPGDVPAFRGVASVILRGPTSDEIENYFMESVGFWGIITFLVGGAWSGFYVGANARMRPFTFWATNIYDSWYSNKAQIGDDMNPAHIIYETLVNDSWGAGLDPTGDIDLNAFESAADTLSNEGFGLSLLWDHSTKVEDFIKDVLRHINASLFIDIHSGKFVLKLIRADYNIDNLPVFDDTNVVNVSGFRRRSMEDITNGVTLKFWDRSEGKTNSITRYNIAMAKESTNTTTVTYKGITKPDLAEEVVARELQELSYPLASLTADLDRSGIVLSPGDTFIFSYPVYGVEEVIMRVKNVEYGSFGDSVIRVEAVEDIFGKSETTYTAPPPSYWTSPVSDPLPCPYHIMYEMPFYVLVQMSGGISDVVGLPDSAGYAALTGTKPTGDTFNATAIFRISGGEYDSRDSLNFPLYVRTTAAIRPDDTSIPIQQYSGPSAMPKGSWGLIGDEIIRVDDANETQFSVGRGCMDTVPREHSIDTKILIINNRRAVDDTRYNNGDVVEGKVLPETSSGMLSEEDAPLQSVTMNSRKVRPYPPGRLRLDNKSDPVDIWGDLNVEWAHRDRTQQTSTSIVDTESGDIGPESGTSYSLEVRKNSDDSLLYSNTDMSGTSLTVTSSDIGVEDIVRLLLWSVRDGYDSWQSHDRSFLFARTESRRTENGEDFRITENGEYRIIEN